MSLFEKFEYGNTYIFNLVYVFLRYINPHLPYNVIEHNIIPFFDHCL